MKSTAKASWAGSMTEGAGKITAGSGLFKDAPYSAKGRFEGGVPGTTPEELIAAAHAGCYTMALGFGLMRAKMPAKSIETGCEVEVVMGSAGADITKSALTCKVEVPGADAAKVREIAEGAKKGCPVSKALAGVKDISLKLDVKV
jgi:osmotically inducible protein OsmC